MPSGQAEPRLDGDPAQAGVAPVDNPDRPELHPGALAVHRLNSCPLVVRWMPPAAAAAELRQDALAEPVRLLQVRVAGENELRDAKARVLLDAVGDLGVAADQGGSSAAADKPDPG